ncbi:MAG: hypothetical protein KatS3mg088_724 [Patescibacteria group bacterium]|nr:MAG: hypothetical protein KatS3mg088_724 [Patescibacteria group bacterium]
MKARRFFASILFLLLLFSFFVPKVSLGQGTQKIKLATPFASPTLEPSPTVEVTPTPQPKVDITQKTEESVGPLEKALSAQKVGPVWPFNFIKYAIRNAVSAGVPANTIVLLLLLPAVAAFISASRHLIGLRGFGIFMPAALSVALIATGPVLGVVIFVVMIVFSTAFRMITRKLKIKLQYLPRMAMVLWFVVIGVLGVIFLAPVIKQPDLANISIFPVLILVLLAEDFSRIQTGKSIRTAIDLTTETLILALLSYLLLTFEPLRYFALLNPEVFLLLVFVADFLVGKYTGLRLMEYWRFRKLIDK